MGKWKPLLQHHGIFAETIEDIIFIVSHTLFLSGIPYLAFFFTAVACGNVQVSSLTSTYRICSKLVEPFQLRTTMTQFNLNYVSNLRIAIIFGLGSMVLHSIAAYFWKEHDIEMFAVFVVIRGTIGWILACWSGRALYTAGKNCEAMIRKYDTITISCSGI